MINGVLIATSSHHMSEIYLLMLKTPNKYELKHIANLEENIQEAVLCGQGIIAFLALDNAVKFLNTDGTFVESSVTVDNAVGSRLVYLPSTTIIIEQFRITGHNILIYFIELNHLYLVGLIFQKIDLNNYSASQLPKQNGRFHREYHCAILYTDNQFVIIGGLNEAGDAQIVAMLYNVLSQTVSDLFLLKQARINPNCTLLDGGKILISDDHGYVTRLKILRVVARGPYTSLLHIMKTEVMM
jgi:hypothetical protein